MNGWWEFRVSWWNRWRLIQELYLCLLWCLYAYRYPLWKILPACSRVRQFWVAGRMRMLGAIVSLSRTPRAGFGRGRPKKGLFGPRRRIPLRGSAPRPAPASVSAGKARGGATCATTSATLYSRGYPSRGYPSRIRLRGCGW